MPLFPRPSFRPLLSGLAALLLLASPAAAERLRVQDAAPEEVARELSRLLGMPVIIRGGAGQTLTLDLEVTAARPAVEQVARLLDAYWARKLLVETGALGEAAPSARDQGPLVHLGLREVPASLAIRRVAALMRVDVELPEGLDQPVTMASTRAPAGTVLDRICRQAGAHWRLAYVLQAPDRPAPPPMMPPAAVVPPVPPPPNPPAEATPEPESPEPAVPTAPTGPELKAVLWEAVNRVLRVDPPGRAAAIRAMLETAEAQYRALSALQPVERNQRLRFAVPVLTHWKRLYGGVAPEVARELAPVTGILEVLVQPHRWNWEMGTARATSASRPANRP